VTQNLTEIGMGACNGFEVLLCTSFVGVCLHRCALVCLFESIFSQCHLLLEAEDFQTTLEIVECLFIAPTLGYDGGRALLDLGSQPPASRVIGDELLGRGRLVAPLWRGGGLNHGLHRHLSRKCSRPLSGVDTCNIVKEM
jgi:hypothetical protein